MFPKMNTQPYQNTVYFFKMMLNNTRVEMNTVTGFTYATLGWKYTCFKLHSHTHTLKLSHVSCVCFLRSLCTSSEINLKHLCNTNIRGSVGSRDRRNSEKFWKWPNHAHLYNVLAGDKDCLKGQHGIFNPCQTVWLRTVPPTGTSGNIAVYIQVCEQVKENSFRASIFPP